MILFRLPPFTNPILRQVLTDHLGAAAIKKGTETTGLRLLRAETPSGTGHLPVKRPRSRKRQLAIRGPMYPADLLSSGGALELRRYSRRRSGPFQHSVLRQSSKYAQRPLAPFMRSPLPVENPFSSRTGFGIWGPRGINLFLMSPRRGGRIRRFAGADRQHSSRRISCPGVRRGPCFRDERHLHFEQMVEQALQARGHCSCHRNAA
jgi:hypothetical protein